MLCLSWKSRLILLKYIISKFFYDAVILPFRGRAIIQKVNNISNETIIAAFVVNQLQSIFKQRCIPPWYPTGDFNSIKTIFNNIFSFFKFCYKLSLVSLAFAVWTCSAVRFFSINSDLYQLVMDFRLINHSVDSVNGYYFYIFSSRNIDISTCNARFTREERIWMWRSEKCTGKLKEVKLTVATDFVLSKWMSGKPVLTSTNKE